MPITSSPPFTGLCGQQVCRLPPTAAGVRRGPHQLRPVLQPHRHSTPLGLHPKQPHLSAGSWVGWLSVAGYPSFQGQVLDGEQLWSLIEGLEANDLLNYTHLLSGTTSPPSRPTAPSQHLGGGRLHRVPLLSGHHPESGGETEDQKSKPRLW